MLGESEFEGRRTIGPGVPTDWPATAPTGWTSGSSTSAYPG